jgi:hypothetical protein
MGLSLAHRQIHLNFFIFFFYMESKLCEILGKETETTKNYFKNFSDFTYLSKNAPRIGCGISLNGFIKELTFENKEGLEAKAVIKTSKTCKSEYVPDNLIYEGFVGKYLNKMSLRYPCFLETYGIFCYDLTSTAYDLMTNYEDLDIDILKSGLILKEEITIDDLKFSIENPTVFSVIIQHIKNADTIVEKNMNLEFLEFDLIYVLFQIYAPLVWLADEFTHYDLHHENVLIYEQENNSYVEYHYHLNDTEIVSFKSKYVAKIIDCGRCYFNDKDNDNDSFYGSSEKIYNELCKLINNDNDMIKKSGLKLFFGENSKYFIDIKKNNKSHQLRLLKMVSRMTKYRLDIMPPHLKQMLSKIVYDEKHGTKEMLESGLPEKINNIMDAFVELTDIVKNTIYVDKNNKRYENLIKLGDLHIYSDGRHMSL